MRGRLLAALVVLVVVSFGLDAGTIHHGGHAEYWWHAVPGFELVFGLVGAGLLAVFAKKALFPLIKRKETYYGDDR